MNSILEPGEFINLDFILSGPPVTLQDQKKQSLEVFIEVPGDRCDHCNLRDPRDAPKVIGRNK